MPGTSFACMPQHAQAKDLEQDLIKGTTQNNGSTK
jgi:hypothetical protein